VDEVTSTRVVVLAGGPSHERDVSIRSGRRTAEALRDQGFDVDERDMDGDLMKALTTDPPACVFPVLHGAAGEDGAIRDILDLLGLPYVGSSPTACRIAFDKPVAKQIVSAAGVATPPSVVLPHATFRELGAAAVLATIEQSLGLPLVVKPTKGGSALGVSIVRTAEELPAAMVSCFSYGDTALVERFIDGTEVAVSVIDLGEGPVALPAVEIVPDGGFYDYTARYTAGMTEFFTPARLDDAALDAVAHAALTAHETLGLRGLSRSDLIVDREGVVQFLEVNVVPGMTETSLFPQALEAAGLDLGEVAAALIRNASA
jgi:D-alanine-D-alanine ligase